MSKIRKVLKFRDAGFYDAIEGNTTQKKILIVLV